jgi:hypothetical protein
MKLRDLKILVKAHGVWVVPLKVVHRKVSLVPYPMLAAHWGVQHHNKGINSGGSLDFLLDPVTKTHNLWFDTGTLLVALLFLHGALEGIEVLALFE